MIVRRLSALLAAVFGAMTTLLVAPAWADDANYPPNVQGSGTGVEGVKAGTDAGTGLQGDAFTGGLANTGFQLNLLLGGIALLLVGILLVFIVRRRHDSV